MDIKLVDVTIHIDEEMNAEQHAKLEETWRSRDGVVSVHFDPKKGHLAIVEYNPDKISAHDLLDVAKYSGVHAELVGL